MKSFHRPNAVHHTTLLPDLALVEAPPIEIAPPAPLDAPALRPAAMNTAIQPHTAEHARLADTLANMRRCSVWALPESFHEATARAIERLDQTAEKPATGPVGWALIREVDPTLPNELAAFEACGALQRMEGELSRGIMPLPWSRERCHEALSAWRALNEHHRRVAFSSYANPSFEYAPAPLAPEPIIASLGIGLRLPPT